MISSVTAAANLLCPKVARKTPTHSFIELVSGSNRTIAEYDELDAQEVFTRLYTGDADQGPRSTRSYKTRICYIFHIFKQNIFMLFGFYFVPHNILWFTQ